MDSKFIIDILGVLGGASAVIVALSGFLGEVWSKRIIQKEKARLDKELEVEKAKLQENLEITKASLSAKTKLVEERLNLINQERFKAIIENYNLLADAWRACRWAIQPDEIGREKPPASERLDVAIKSIESFFEDFERKRLFLSEESQNAIYDFLTSIWGSLKKLNIFSESDAPLEKKMQDLYEPWIHELKPKLDAARKSIELEYKEVIGVSEHNRALLQTSR
jgi:hypothetical protein